MILYCAGFAALVSCFCCCSIACLAEMEEGGCGNPLVAGLLSLLLAAAGVCDVGAARSDFRTGTACTVAGAFAVDALPVASTGTDCTEGAVPGVEALPAAKTGIAGAAFDNCGCALSVVLTGGSCVLVVSWALTVIDR